MYKNALRRILAALVICAMLFTGMSTLLTAMAEEGTEVADQIPTEEVPVEIPAEEEPAADPEPAPVADPEPAPEADPEPAPAADPEPAPAADPEPVPEADPEPAPAADPEPAPEADPEPAPAADPEPAPEADQEPAPAADPEPDPAADPEPVPEADPDPVPAADPEPVADLAAAPADEPVPAADPEPVAALMAAPADEPAPEADPEPIAALMAAPADEPAPEADPEPAPVADPEPAPAADPAPAPAADPAPATEPDTKTATEDEPVIITGEEDEDGDIEIIEYETPLNAGSDASFAVYANGTASIRKAADGMSPVIRTVADGTAILVTGREGDWYIVKDEGYVFCDEIRFTAEKPEEETRDDEKVPAAQPETQESEKKVYIFTSRRDVMNEGETVYLTSKISGFEGYEILYQWECNKGDGFKDVPGANEANYKFSASVETLSWSWRLTVYYR